LLLGKDHGIAMMEREVIPGGLRNEDKVSIRSRAHDSRLEYSSVLAHCAQLVESAMLSLHTRHARCNVSGETAHVSAGQRREFHGSDP